MHRCLLVAEIVCLISHQIENSSLPSFARVCKAFRDPALDVLWSHQDSLGNLLRCMPEGVWEEAPGVDEDVTWSLTRPVLPSDWERPLLYARRVKVFIHDARTRVMNRPTSSEFMDSLRDCLPCQHLFPNIQTLWFYSHDEWTFRFVRLFLGPLINSMFLASPQSMTDLSLLAIIAADCPTLRSLEIVCTDTELDSETAVSALIHGLHGLEHIKVPCLNNAALEHAARLPSLKTLQLRSQTTLDPFRDTFVSNSTLFPALRTLAISGDNIDAVLPLLTLITNVQVESLAVDLPHELPAKCISQLYSAIARYCMKNRTSLKQLSYGHAPRRPTAIATSAETTAYLLKSPQVLLLTSFENLVFCTLASPLGFDLDNSTTADLAQAWPHLRELHIVAGAFVNHPSHVTLEGLLPFAQNCPHLSRLALPLEVSSPPSWPRKIQSSDGKRISQNALIVLDVCRSRLDINPLHVAAFLSSVFPRLGWIFTDQEPPPEDPPEDDVEESTEGLTFHERWKAVAAALPFLRNARAEERIWLRQ
ncbi:hypothetical protein R3P38DRAFT_2879087 [Favolaschia claudopus]|uniref:F-box domain-containing protein n=1 Tax=Favolaschia claudopus TaxID=2862362 RepID=A0AAW0D108_9AGAR